MEGGGADAWWYVERGVIMFMCKVFQMTTETHQSSADSVTLAEEAWRILCHFGHLRPVTHDHNVDRWNIFCNLTDHIKWSKVIK